MPQPSVRLSGGTGGLVPSPSCGKLVQTLSFTVWNVLRAVHERDGGDVGQVNLDQLRVHFLQRGRIGLGRDGA